MSKITPTKEQIKNEIMPFDEAKERAEWEKLNKTELIELLVDANQCWTYWESEYDKLKTIKDVQITATQVGELNAYKVFFDRLHPSLTATQQENAS